MTERLAMDDRDKRSASGPILGSVVGQYFGFFDGVSRQHYQEIVARAPFEDCNLLILGFVHAMKKGEVYVAQFTNWRDNPKYPPAPGDSDQDRLRLVVKAARAKNPSIKILISLGWGTNDAGNAATTPGPFAQSIASIVQTFGLDGIDIDYESTEVQPKNMLVLAQQLKQALSKVSPKQMIMTITPAQMSGLDASVLQAFTYTMPQTYEHDGNGTTATWYEQQLGSFDRIVYGLNSEGYIGQSDDPKKFAAEAKAHQAAGIFAWRLDNDSLDQEGFPTFATGIEMWELMTSPGEHG
jgi:hypothetical protein